MIRKLRKTLWIPLAIAACAAAVVVGAANLLTIADEYGEGTAVYEDLARLAITTLAVYGSVPDPSEDRPLGDTVAGPGLPEAPSQQDANVDFDVLCAINPEVVGWLRCEGTPIDYPIVRGADNEFYLNHLFNGRRNSAGCLFMDCGSAPDFSDTNSVVYGHNMNNGSMFAALLKYKKQEFFDLHPRLTLLTPERSYAVDLIAGFVTGTDGDSWRTAFTGPEDLRSWLDDARGRSAFLSDVPASVDDRFITLSTCSYDYDDARFVVIGRVTAYAP